MLQPLLSLVSCSDLHKLLVLFQLAIKSSFQSGRKFLLCIDFAVNGDQIYDELSISSSLSISVIRSGEIEYLCHVTLIYDRTAKSTHSLNICNLLAPAKTELCVVCDNDLCFLLELKL